MAYSGAHETLREPSFAVNLLVPRKIPRAQCRSRSDGNPTRVEEATFPTSSRIWRRFLLYLLECIFHSVHGKQSCAELVQWNIKRNSKTLKSTKSVFNQRFVTYSTRHFINPANLFLARTILYSERRKWSIYCLEDFPLIQTSVFSRYKENKKRDSQEIREKRHVRLSDLNTQVFNAKNRGSFDLEIRFYSFFESSSFVVGLKHGATRSGTSGLQNLP